MTLYGQYCPVARATELLADRWTLLIIRELLADIRRFNDLDRGLPGISRALLVERLRRLEQSGVVERRAADGRSVEYHLTPAGRTVIQFDFRGERSGSYWLVLERRDVSVCLQHPKFEIDLRIAADIRAFYRVWLGRIPLGDALRARTVRLDGAPEAIRGFARWFTWSPMAPAVRAASRAS